MSLNPTIPSSTPGEGTTILGGTGGQSGPSGPSQGWLTVATGGWAIVIGFAIGILLGNTQFAPLVAGVLGVGLLYQLVNLVEGK